MNLKGFQNESGRASHQVVGNFRSSFDFDPRDSARDPGDFQAVGEFVLAKSTAPGDSFQVQIRTAPWYQGAFASVTVAVAASVGANRVTFDLSRQAVVWVDGHPVTLAPGGTPIDLGQGTLQELTASSWAMLAVPCSHRRPSSAR